MTSQIEYRINIISKYLLWILESTNEYHEKQGEQAVSNVVNVVCYSSFTDAAAFIGEKYLKLIKRIEDADRTGAKGKATVASTTVLKSVYQLEPSGSFWGENVEKKLGPIAASLNSISISDITAEYISSLFVGNCFRIHLQPRLIPRVQTDILPRPQVPNPTLNPQLVPQTSKYALGNGVSLSGVSAVVATTTVQQQQPVLGYAPERTKFQQSMAELVRMNKIQTLQMNNLARAAEQALRTSGALSGGVEQRPFARPPTDMGSSSDYSYDNGERIVHPAALGPSRRQPPGTLPLSGPQIHSIPVPSQIGHIPLHRPPVALEQQLPIPTLNNTVSPTISTDPSMVLANSVARGQPTTSDDWLLKSVGEVRPTAYNHIPSLRVFSYKRDTCRPCRCVT